MVNDSAIWIRFLLLGTSSTVAESGLFEIEARLRRANSLVVDDLCLAHVWRVIYARKTGVFVRVTCVNQTHQAVLGCTLTVRFLLACYRSSELASSPLSLLLKLGRQFHECFYDRSSATMPQIFTKS